MLLKQKAPIWTKNFIGIAVTNFFIFLVFYALLTTLPIYVVDDLQRTNADAGLVVTLFLFAAIFTRPISGKILDSFGKKRTLLICLFFYLLSTILYVWIESFFILLLLRFFHGIWFSIVTTATGAIAADLVPPARRGEGLGYFAMSMNIAVVAGPFLALTLLQVANFTWLFLALIVIMLSGFVFSFFIEVQETDRSLIKDKKLSLDDFVEKRVLPLALVGFVVAFSYSSVISFISIYAQGKNLLTAASYFFVVFAVVMLISRPFVGRLFDAKGPNIVIYPAILLFSLGLFTLSVANTSFVLLFAGALIGLGYGTLVPCFQTLAIQTAQKERSGHATATFFTLFDGGVAAGSFILGIIAAQFSYETLYATVAIVSLTALIIYKRVRRRHEHSDINVQS